MVSICSLACGGDCGAILTDLCLETNLMVTTMSMMTRAISNTAATVDTAMTTVFEGSFSA